MEQAKLEQRLARLQRGIEQGLELLGRGRAEEARELLAELVGSPLADGMPASRSISDDELELAFADARPEREQMRNADDVAQEAMLRADLDLEAEGGMSPDEVGENFATETMAELLERQGDGQGASRIRAALGSRPDPPDRPSRSDVVATLEHWLDNLRGGAPA